MDDNTDDQILEQILQSEKEKNYTRIKQEMFQELAQERKEKAEFEERLYLRWKKALDLFETIFLLGRECGGEFNKQVRPYAAKQNDLVFEVLTRMHARACLTTSAILSLLKTGHAGDALARSRTLHELHVTMYFIQQGGNELAEQYLLSQVVETFKAAKQYEKHSIQLGLEPVDPEILTNLERQVNQYRVKFGEQYSKAVTRGNYGWASEVLHKQQPTFEDIEDAVGLANLRFYYKTASYPIHASAKGLMFDIGEIGYQKVLPAGPSNAGLANPACMTLASFNRCTALLVLYPCYSQEPGLAEIYLKSLVANHVMQELIQEARQAFHETHDQLVSEELVQQASEEK